SHSIDGLVLTNEVIADLPVESGRTTGAIRLIGELARVLRSGGAALLTEFGGDFAPGPIRLLGAFAEGEHVEWSIDFRQLRAAAAAAGLLVEELPLHELLGTDLSVRCASYTDLWRLRRFASCEVFAAPEAEVRRRFPLLSRVLALELPPLGSPRWTDAAAGNQAFADPSLLFSGTPGAFIGLAVNNIQGEGSYASTVINTEFSLGPVGVGLSLPLNLLLWNNDQCCTGAYTRDSKTYGG